MPDKQRSSEEEWTNRTTDRGHILRESCFHSLSISALHSFLREKQTEPCPRTTVSIMHGDVGPLEGTCAQTGMCRTFSTFSTDQEFSQIWQSCSTPVPRLCCTALLQHFYGNFLNVLHINYYILNKKKVSLRYLIIINKLFLSDHHV